MNGQGTYQPLKLADRHLAELATGGGSDEALDQLERGERTRRLLLLGALHDRTDAPVAPLGSPDVAWQALRTAYRRDAGQVERLLLSPSVGSWVGHLLRRLHGTAEGPELWTEWGHLHRLAVSAALLASTDVHLPVPVTDGRLPLPGLGLLRLPGRWTGHRAALATVHAGELTVSSGQYQVSLDPAHGPESAVWLPLRSVAPGVLLEDLDPYRDLDGPVAPARLDAAEFAAWRRVFADAGEVLGARTEPGPGRLDPGRIRSVIPWGRVGVLPPPEPTVRRSATTGDAYGAMVITRPAGGVMLAETLVHEFQHSKLAALLHLFPLLDDDRAERYYAPWRADPRHLTGLLHGAYAFIGVTGFWRDRMSDGSVAPGTAAYYFALRRLQTRLVVRTLATSDRLTAPGRRLVAGLADTLDGWLREPVPDDALRRARTAAHLHRTEWRLRNLRPPRSSPRPTTAFWPDIRTHAFAVRPGVPRTADEFLAADDPEAATNRYARLDPVDPHVRAGRLVAYATLHPGRTGRRILARPESVRLPGSATPR